MQNWILYRMILVSRGSPGGESEGVPIFSPRRRTSILRSFDREYNSEPNTTIFRLNTGHRANRNNKYNIFMYKKWVKKTVFRPKLHFLLDDLHRNWHHSIENRILHLTQATRKLTQVMKRIRTRKTRIWCQLHLRRSYFLMVTHKVINN
jgi:hypothetical protein